jgi:predicted permease
VSPFFTPHPRGPGRWFRLRNLFVVGQVAMALVLLVSASLFMRALQHAATIDPGFTSADVDVVFLDLRMGGVTGARSPAFVRQLLDRVRSEPSVREACVAGVVPMGGDGLSFGGVRRPLSPAAEDSGGLEADWNVVTADYFRTLGIPIVSGRTFTDADASSTSGVAVINQTMAHRLWPGEDPIGRSFEVVGPQGAERALQVVGVARDAKYRWLGDRARLFVYVPFGQQAYDRQALMIRRRGEESSVPAVRQILRDLSPGMPMIQATTLNEYAGLGLLPQRLAAWVAGSLGLVGLLLAALGIYGVTAYNAVQRTRELGIRIALGADRSGVTRLVLWHGFRLAVAGAALGALGAAGLGTLFGSLLLGVGATDPIAFASASSVFVVATLAASWFPARRAASRDPVEALRAD